MDYQLIISLLTLIALEVVLGIDNIIFISILAGKLPPEQQRKARNIGILLAMVMRLGLLAAIAVIMKLDNELFNLFSNSITGKDLILILGGLFLIYKSVKEIYHKMEGEHEDGEKKITAASFANIIGQILLLDLVFSVDSIITAVGLANELWVMYVAVIVTVVIMLIAAAPISNFVNKHPAFKILALSFLLLIGFTLLVEGFGVHIPKGYIYFAMAFAFLVDVLQMKIAGKKSHPVKLNEHFTDDDSNL
ncbi:MAG: TerC family protein [Chitinophagaceae bacterium]|nr:TerC family protein [Chitinophagaceae bacterium]MBK8606676.1 TerC family protein [Chitinophagaceae bacterium]MBP6477560.1 TerC family protein [Chitinophagaceae bacterium]MBP7107935.1 TerC family protein [Chitinophagaceae bacterium]MBP7314047.1 TerC family protein [Chitinophagaceae bacterium]